MVNVLIKFNLKNVYSDYKTYYSEKSDKFVGKYYVSSICVYKKDHLQIQCVK